VTATTPLPGTPYAAAVGPARELLVTKVAALSLARGTLPATDLPVSIEVSSSLFGVTINATGTRGYGGGGSRVVVLDLVADVALPAITGLAGSVFDVKVSPDGGELYAGTDGRLYRINATSGAALASVPAAPATWVVLHPALPRVYATHPNASAVVEHDATTLAELRRFAVTGTPQGLAIRPDGSELFVAVEGPNEVEVWDLATGARIQEAPLGGAAFGLVVAGDRLVVSQSSSGSVEFLDLASRVSLQRLIVGGLPRRLAANAAGIVLVVPNESGWVDFIE
jgi:DNA-binding beta-propeller fold protein YncE